MSEYLHREVFVLFISAIGLFVSVVVLLITYKTYVLKYGQKVRGWVSESSFIASDHTYFQAIVLENLKDKDLVIFNMYIRIGHNIYLDMLDKDDDNKPYTHIIPALSTKEFKFGPPIEYVSGSESIDLSNFLFNGKVKKKIVLSTNLGKLIVAPIKKGWDPISDGFKNYGTAIVRPIRYYSDSSVYGYNGKNLFDSAINYDSYGSRTLYLVRVKRKDFGLITYPIMEGAKVQYFANIEFPDTVLENADVLKEFLFEERSKGVIEFENIENIFDFKAYVKKVREQFPPSGISLKAEGWFKYTIADRLQTYLYNRKHFKYKR